MDSVITGKQKVLVLECHEHTLTVLRSLTAAGFEAILGVTDNDLQHGYVHISKTVSSTWVHPDIVRDSVEFDRAFLHFLAADPGLKLVYPVGEDSVRRLSALKADLSPDISIAMPDPLAVENCLNKPGSYRVAERAGVPTPGSRAVSSAQEFRDAVTGFGLPCIGKATDSTSLLFGKKCVFVRSQQDLDAVTEDWPLDMAEVVVQREIRGRRHNCDIVAENGRIKRYFESEIIRTDQADYAGNSVFDRSTAPDPQRQAYCEQFLADLNYTGVALIQFLKDANTGQNFFIEANPRAGSTIGNAVNCGVDLPASAMQARLGGLSESVADYPLNRAQNWLHGDLLGLRKALQTGEIGRKEGFVWFGRALMDFLRADSHTTFVWRDPKPTLRLYRNLLLRTFFKRMRRGADQE